MLIRPGKGILSVITLFIVIAVSPCMVYATALPNEQGTTYYLPDGLTDVRSLEITGFEILITSKADRGEVVMTFIKKISLLLKLIHQYPQEVIYFHSF